MLNTAEHTRNSQICAVSCDSSLLLGARLQDDVEIGKEMSKSEFLAVKIHLKFSNLIFFAVPTLQACQHIF